MRALLIVLTLTMAAFAGCLDDDGHPLGSQAPEWSPGYSHAFRIDGKVEAVATVDGKTERDSAKFGPVVAVEEVLSAQQQVGGDPSYLVAIQYDKPSEWFAMDGKPVDRLLGLVRQRDFAGQVTEIAGSKLKADPFPAESFIDFPLTKGKKWTLPEDDFHAWLSFGKHRNEIQWAGTGKVVGSARADTGVGSLDAILVEHSYRPTNLGEWAQAVRGSAQSAGVDLHKLDARAGSTYRIYYNEAYQDTVRVDWFAEVFQHVAGVAQGESFDIMVQVKFEFSTSLVGARLVPGPERDLAFAADFWENKLPWRDSAAGCPKPADYGVRIAATQESANAADREKVTFAADLLGTQALPAGHRFAWRLLGPDGQQAATADGRDVEFTFETPGVYRIELTAVDATGSVAAADGRGFAANYRTAKPATCPTVAVLGVPSSCVPLNFPVPPGAKSLVVEAIPSAAAPQLMSGTLELRDADDRIIDRRSGSGPIKITVENPQTYATGAWTLRWTPEVGVAGTLEYRVDLRFDEPQPAVAAAPGGSGASARDFGVGGLLNLR
jgi:hypothetical protein